LHFLIAMLTRLKKGLLPKVEAETEISPRRTGIATAELLELMRCFPIGGKIRYFPEYNKDIVLDSIVLAYSVNDQIIYTQNDIEVDSGEGMLIFLSELNRGRPVVREVETFSLLIPYVAPTQNDLDYIRRAALETDGYLRRGEGLILMAPCTARGVPHVDCIVKKRVLMKEGYYANHAMAVLETRTSSFKYIDQRRHVRLRTQIPVMVKAAEAAPDCAGTLVDFSESSLRIRLGERAGAIAEKKALIATIDLSKCAARGREQRFVVSGKVVRRDAECVVLNLTGRLKNNRFRELESMDALDLKVSLLQHPATHA
jgi:hypothetical protein